MLHTYRQRRRGQAVLLLSIAMIPMIGLVGLAVDIGYMEFTRKAAQTAADTAALAAISRFYSDIAGTPGCSVNGSGQTGNVSPTPCVSSWQCPHSLTNSSNPGNAVETACVYARQNGFWPWKSTGIATNQNVMIDANVASSDSPPPTAPGAKSATYYVTVRVSQAVPQGFSAILGNATGMVAARATAAVVPGAGDCIFVLDPTAGNAYYQNGTTALTANCGIYVNSNASNAMSNVGSSTISATDYNIVGDYSWHGTISPPPNTGAPAVSDPFAALAAPAPCPNSGGCNAAGCGASATTYEINGTVDVPPGTYCGGIRVKNGTANFTGGVYRLVGGGLSTQNSNSHISGTGTFYNTYDNNHPYTALSLSGSSDVQLSAPNSGAYAGILFMQDRTCCSTSMPYESVQGRSSAKFEGALYFPRSVLQFAGNPSMSTARYTIIVARQFNMVGTSNMNVDFSLVAGGNPVKQVALIE